MAANRRLALMIDGDNAQAELLPQILAEVSKYGTMTIRRVYGDWTTTQLRSWKEVLHTYALKPEQQFSYTSGKNATDSALIIDAMDIIYTAGVDGLCIVSSDSDYTRLATRIREKNLFVMGIGRNTTPRAFVHACDVFVYTQNLQSVADDSKTELSVPIAVTENAVAQGGDDPTNLAPLERLFLTAFDSAVQDDGWAHLGTVGGFLRQLDPGFDPRTYGHKQLSQLVQAFPDFFEIQKRASKGGNEVIYIRLRGDPQSGR
ncbi:MAG: NYN domain-containing protein [Chloroflexi bacterium]|nr:NYN domain-containing protein [Chloroflexota bacterium]